MNDNDEVIDEEVNRLQQHAWAVIDGLHDTGMEATDGVFVLVLALARFVVSMPEADRAGGIEHVTHMLAAMVPLAGTGGDDPALEPDMDGPAPTNRPRYDA
jgi:hypothetical protein